MQLKEFGITASAPAAPKPEKTTRTWSDTEIATLRERYPSSGVRGVLRLLPHRTRASINVKAHQIGLQRLNKDGTPRKNSR